MGPSASDVLWEVATKEDSSGRFLLLRYRKNVYLFVYYLIQFCGHSWIFTNMTVRFFSFGKDSMIDTFYAIGLVMRICQSISLLELLHIYVGIESNHLFPRFLQLTERIIILFVVITSQEEIQEKYVVCVLFIFWNLLDMVRYTHSMLAVIGTSYAVLTWLSQTLWMPIYPLCVLAEEFLESLREYSMCVVPLQNETFAIYQSLPYFESFGTYSAKLPFDLTIYFPYVLKLYLMMLFIGMYFTYSHLYSERRDVLRIFSTKKKKM
ncbi:PREDICTED: very-long-chain (3R)-3-hydroxyacyl-CoA dehydratase 4 isoform X1 [Chinchilla lanigera]|uniref:very-long-chain (3R)-3-hydroxyacyl-CoA dehydratase 4 isoform X1 n=1 Tax=Chinchilla lanigera TaxID=34839 RepID=UPI00069722D3|nr:PREDICTED: very-long-chain (3R)-3-hydroxyacyl-CoA dehydratase 4 isoform X1 [Chinchilla lanigera]